MKDSKSAQSIFVVRWYLYRLFWALLATEPKEEVWEIVSSEMTDEALDLFDVETTSYGEAVREWKAVRDAVKKNSSVREGLFGARDEYVRLFLGPGEPAVCPWESQYLTHDRSIFQERTLQVRNAYRAQGFLPREYPHVADDHIALECGFMAALAERINEAYADEDEARIAEVLEASTAFLDDHLLQWVSLYAEKMANENGACFYPALVTLLSEFAAVDRALLAEFAAS